MARRPLALRLVVLHGRNFLGTLFGISQGTFLQNEARLKRDAQSQVGDGDLRRNRKNLRVQLPTSLNPILCDAHQQSTVPYPYPPLILLSLWGAKAFFLPLFLPASHPNLVRSLITFDAGLTDLGLGRKLTAVTDFASDL